MLSTSPLNYPIGFDPSLKQDKFGIILNGIEDINNLTDTELIEIKSLLYNHSIVLFQNVNLTPEGQFKLTNAFDPQAKQYGHGTIGRPEAKSILHPDLRTIPSQPAVQLIGNGPINDSHITQGLNLPCQLKHPTHETFHKTILSKEESNGTSEGSEGKKCTRFYRWHIDAALYDLDPPKVTTLYALKVPSGPKQTVRYDDGSNEELEVSIGGTAFVSGKKMFSLLTPELKSLAIRSSIVYAPHPYIWMSSAKAINTGLGLVSEGLEIPLDQLPDWKEEKIKVYPMLWKNPITGELNLQVHPCGVQKIIIAPLPIGSNKTLKTLYPEGTTLTDLKEVRSLLYKIQRPAISPQFVYTHDWKEKDLALFNNRAILHTITGSFEIDEQRAFWQCNLASTDRPQGPNEEDIAKYA